MLEDPSYKQVVRWGTEGDSFVVLDVGLRRRPYGSINLLTWLAERQIHKIHSSKTLQAQQFCQFRPTTEQIRFPQGPAQ